MRIGYVLAVVGLGAALAACSGSKYPDSTKVPAKYMPKVNPNPKYFMTVKGFIDPRLKGRIHLTIVAEYNNYNPKCNLWISHLQGANTPWQIFRDYKIKPDAKGGYEIKIPLDHYQQGKCNWHVAAIRYRDYKASDGNSPFVMIFDKNARVDALITHGRTNITCTTNSCNHVIYYGFGGRTPPGFSFKQDYTYVRNYFLKEKAK